VEEEFDSRFTRRQRSQRSVGTEYGREKEQVQRSDRGQLTIIGVLDVGRVRADCARVGRTDRPSNCVQHLISELGNGNG
jgi:hypothetical protein